MRLMLHEELHLGVLLGRLHLSVDHHHAVRREHLSHKVVPLLEALEVDLLIFLNQRVHDVDLPSLGQLLAGHAVDLVALVVVAEQRPDRFAAGWQLVDHRHIEVAIDRHGQCARDRCRRHHQHMRHAGAFAPEACALHHAEAVLLVDHHHPQRAKLHIVLDQRMSANEDVQTPGHQFLMDQIALFLAGGSGEEAHIDAERSRHLAYRFEMLGGEDLRRGHQARLEAVVERHEHRHERHDGLARTHIALQEAVHLPSRAHIGANLAEHPLLRSGEREGEHLGVETVEKPTYARKRDPLQRGCTPVAVALDVELQVEQLLKLQPFACALQRGVVGRIVHRQDGIVAAHEAVALHQIGRKSLRQASGERCDGVLHPHVHIAHCDAAVAQLFGEGIHSAEPNRGAGRFRRIDFRVHHAPAAVEQLWFAEKHIVAPHVVMFAQRAYLPEPHHFHRGGAVGEKSHQPHLGPFALSVEGDETPLDLHRRHLA